MPTDIHVAIPDISSIESKSTGTAILHRTPWVPPIAVSGEGVYIALSDGRTLVRSSNDI